MSTRKLAFFIVLVLIAGCEKPTGEKPRVLKARFLSEQYTVEESIKMSATVISALPATVSYTWSVNGKEVSAIDDTELPAVHFSKYDTIICVITVKDSLGIEAEPYTLGPITVKNALPKITFADISPTDSIYKGIDLSVDYEAEDPDNDAIIIQYTWYVGKSLVTTDSILKGQLLEAGKNVNVELIPFDGDTTGNQFDITRPIIVKNLPPNIIGSPVFTVQDSIVTCKINAEDPDGDPITFAITTGPPGITIDTTGFIQWKFPEQANDTTYSITITVTDSKGAGAELQIPLKLTKKPAEEQQ